MLGIYQIQGHNGHKTVMVQVPSNWVLSFGVMVILVHVLGKYMTIGYLDP